MAKDDHVLVIDGYCWLTDAQFMASDVWWWWMMIHDGINGAYSDAYNDAYNDG